MKLRNKKGQNVAEYAILIALVVGAIIAMQTFIQRAYQGRMKDASAYMVDNTQYFGGTYNTGQYEPYYKSSTYTSTRDAIEEQFSNSDTAMFTGDTNTSRTGNQTTSYTAGGTVGTGMTID